MGPAAGVLTKHEEMCHFSHSDLIYTLVSSHSDWSPTGHSDLSEGKQPSPQPLRATLTTRVHLQQVWIKKRKSDRKGNMTSVSNVADRNIK